MLIDKYCRGDEIEEDHGSRICRLYAEEKLPNNFGASDDKICSYSKLFVNRRFYFIRFIF